MRRRERQLRARLGLPLGLIERRSRESAVKKRSRRAMTPLANHAARCFFIVVATLASYISRVYSEFGKILSRDVQENLDAWEERIEPHLGLSREHAALCASVLQQLALGLIALEFGAILFIRPAHLGPPTAAGNRPGHSRRDAWSSFSPISSSRRFSSTARAACGRARLLWPIRLLLWLVTPITVFIRFFFSVARAGRGTRRP